MSKVQEKLKELLLKTEWTGEEEEWMRKYINAGDEQDLKRLLLQHFEVELEKNTLTEMEHGERLLSDILNRIGQEKTSKSPSIIKKLWFKIAVAASIAGLLVVGLSWFKGFKKFDEITNKNGEKVHYTNDVLPGTDKAILILADGSRIELNKSQNGTLSQQGSTKVIKLDGKLSYVSGRTSGKEVLYNTINTPRGGRYQIELPDGSQVWLNAASSLRFPTAFTGAERRVFVSGEAYFEISENKKRPFKVSVDNAEIIVLGTHFNVSAYSDDALLKTTLLEGSVKFSSGATTSILKPGQQSQLAKDGETKVANDVNVNAVTAWKNDYFYFERADIKTVLVQLARWYDIEVEYKRLVNNRVFAEIPRNTKLSDVLRVLQLTSNIQFEIKGKKLIVF